jgi:hypothetical protein
MRFIMTIAAALLPLLFGVRDAIAANDGITIGGLLPQTLTRCAFPSPRAEVRRLCGFEA